MIRHEGNRSVMVCDTAGCDSEVSLPNRGFQALEVKIAPAVSPDKRQD